MIQALIDAFENDITNCVLETNDALIEVYDDYSSIDQRCYIKLNETDPVHFTLYNKTGTSIVFAALDNCILQPRNQSRCDFIIGNFLKLYFVEIKQVKARQRQTARTDAIQQLHSSITLLKSKIDLSDTKLIAVICLKAKTIYPLQTATRVADIVAFKENYNARLMEGQSDIF